MAENEIIQSLQQKGMKYKEISEALAQSRIKAAVEEPTQEGSMPEAPGMAPPQEANQIPKNNLPPQQNSEEISGMQKSVLEKSEGMSPIQTQSTQQMPTEEYTSPSQETAPQVEMMQTEEYSPEAPIEGQQMEYSSYDPSIGGISSDVITEISEQVVSEKLSETRKHLEKVIDFKTAIEAKTESIEERLKRIEKIIDTLQSSILRKVGDYVTNVDDIKKELIETQKSFSRLLPELKSKPEKSLKKISKK
jgi:hypothetical protein